MNEVLKIAEMSDEMIRMRDVARMDKKTEDSLVEALVDAYNKGVDAMYNQVQRYLNDMALEKAFGRKQ